MADDPSEETAGLTGPYSRRWMLRGMVGGASGLLVATAIGAANAVADDDDDTPDTPDDSDHSGHGGGGDEDDPVISGDIPAGSIEVLIDDDDADAFSPGNLTVDAGQSVTFINADDDPHTASGSGFDTGIIEPGGTATVVLDTPGTFAYACQIHPIMTGSIAVRGADGQVPPPEENATPADATTVQITNFSFDPSTLTVPAGTTVAWSNDDSAPHTVTAVDGSFDSGIFDPGGDFSREFTEPGVYAYACDLHPQMQGTVEVTGDSLAIAEATPVAGTPTAGGMIGGWTVELTPGADAGLSPLQAIATFHDDGTLDATLVIAGDGESGIGFALGPAHGTWTDDGAGTIRSVLVAFLLDAEQRYAGTLTLHEDIDLNEGSATYQGAFTFTAEGANGEALASGEGTSRGERMQSDDAAIISLATPVASPAGAGEATVVTIRDFAFGPPEIDIPSGGTVTWVNEGEAPHTATADDGSFDTGQLDPGQEGNHTFDQAGSYSYFCAIHPDMQGIIVVS